MRPGQATATATTTPASLVTPERAALEVYDAWVHRRPLSEVDDYLTSAGRSAAQQAQSPGEDVYAFDGPSCDRQPSTGGYQCVFTRGSSTLALSVAMDPADGARVDGLAVS